VKDSLSAISDAGADHPILVGTFVLVVLISTTVHAIILVAHLLLAVSRYFRRQAAELHELSIQYRDEWAYWRRGFDLDRARLLPPEAIDAELKRHNVDAERTTAIVTAVAAAVLRELENSSHKASQGAQRDE